MEHDFRRRAAAFALAALTLPLLGGCAQMVQERPLMDVSQQAIEPGADVPEQDAYADHRERVTLYFVSAGGERLVPVSREVTLSGGMSRAQAALEALFAGPLEGETGATWPDKGSALAVRGLEVSGGVATVNLPARYRALNQEMLYAVRLAVASTLCSFSEISYVNVLVGGREEGLDLGATLPVGTFSGEEDLEALVRYGRLEDQRQSSEGFTCMTTMYVPAQGGDMLLPIVRSVAYAQASPVDYLYTLLGEMGKGAGNELAMQGVPAPMDYIEEMPEIVRPENGAYRAIEIRFSSQLDAALEAASLTRGIYMAMLTDTLMGFVPGVEGVQAYIGGELLTVLDAGDTPDGREIALEQGLATREHFAGYVGAPRTLYAQGLQEGTLCRVRCVLPQARQAEPRELLLALMQISEEGRFALPDGFDEADVLAVCVEEENVVVNLSRAFGDALAALEQEQARVAVYAMVNTLTQGRDQQGVIFFFEGEQLGELNGGLNMRGRLVRNPGMVVE